MGNFEMPIPPWLSNDRERTRATAKRGGLLDGLPQIDRGSSLHLLLDPADMESIEGLSAVDREGSAPLVVAQAGQRGGVSEAHNFPMPAQPRNPIGPVAGYPETGKDAWRAGNDDAIVTALNKYNSENKYFPGDAEYITPQLMKSWMMEESGGHRRAFETDPFQVNNLGDWVPEKGKIAGLTKGQGMSPQTSAEAALKWLRYKGRWPEIDSSSIAARRVHFGPYEALLNYNGNKTLKNGVEHRVNYANRIMNRAWDSYGDWQE
ncbi:MAG TPA: hypothetical protein VJ750_03175 [Rhizomicrobium sp.]|nr:hypothetical protein [Rhizomicrobium sp.]